MALSPMMQEYINTKEKYKDCILLYRLGDFYEMFFEDAITVSKELELTLTGKSCGLEEKAPMCGVPQAALDTYVSKLIAKGFKVAICEQLEDAKASKGIVKRGVVKVVTPGTVTETKLLDDKQNSYIMCIAVEKKEDVVGVSSVDVTTGEFYVTKIKVTKGKEHLRIYDEIARFSPKEIIVSEEISKDEKYNKMISHIQDVLNIYITEKAETYFQIDEEKMRNISKYIVEKKSGINELEVIQKEDNKRREENENKAKNVKHLNYQTNILEEIENTNIEKENVVKKEIEKRDESVLESDISENEKIDIDTDININIKIEELDTVLKKAIIGMDSYISETQMQEVGHISKIYLVEFEKYMMLDTVARRNLELTSRMKDGSKKGSLLWILDKTKTSMGARLLARWINDPLLSKNEIEKRLDAVEELYTNIILRGSITEILKKIYDIERIAGKVAFKNVNGKDMISLKNSVKYLPELKQVLENVESAYLKEILLGYDELEDIYKIIDEMIEEEPPITITEGGLIKETFNDEIYRLKNLGNKGKEWIIALEETEREKTGIRNLKVGYNKVFGYYLEVTNSFKDKVPENYIRKQTLVGAERYITPELKEMEEELLNAESKIIDLEYKLFNTLRDYVAENIERIKKVSEKIAEIDVFASLATVAENNGYVKPSINLEGKIEIKEGRHPVVEKTLKTEKYISNDCILDNETNTAIIITGPNMSGKSTYMRQIALITLMAQIGSYVPAEKANIGIVDKIFTRIGASDDVTMGQSTFMMEMSEVAAILNGATKNSLIILDEIGRGTSTYDGMSIGTAVIEHIADKKKIGAKTLFATHYHELTELESMYSNIKNYHVEAKEIGQDVLFLRKVLRGGTDESYGIHVAKLAGVPKEVVRRANKLLLEIEAKKNIVNIGEIKEEISQSNFEELENNKIISEIKSIDINTLTPIEALNELVNLKKLVEKN